MEPGNPSVNTELKSRKPVSPIETVKVTSPKNCTETAQSCLPLYPTSSQLSTTNNESHSQAKNYSPASCKKSTNLPSTNIIEDEEKCERTRSLDELHTLLQHIRNTDYVQIGKPANLVSDYLSQLLQMLDKITTDRPTFTTPGW